MASVSCAAYAGISYGRPATSTNDGKPRRMVAVRAETVNLDIRKTEDKVVDSVLVVDLSKPVTAYCRFSFESIRNFLLFDCSEPFHWSRYGFPPPK
ncbi:CDGSH iron-sulfur domain-containing protein 2-like [Dorcoceras hygrometricum]|uniref:CDGSH iron-sulfur domain-containing protein 2-like n=1 Tax=Dorcoceras hygrometricum TaxID=472368 RepID=A0A2Z7C2C4_9LAMI|nr:CDGSH iron-sulfur domain-containing protein 2-like [Dorcoceras hygrometricum]